MTAMVPHCVPQSLLEKLDNSCESPIEIKFGIAIFLAHFANHQDREECPFCNFLLIPQYEFGHYRFDWAVTGNNQHDVYLFIECDGHDFHERTKEQAAHDRQKDRFAQINGIPIFRYTGSEIHSQPNACARQVLDFVERFSAA